MRDDVCSRSTGPRPIQEFFNKDYEHSSIVGQFESKPSDQFFKTINKNV